MCKRIVLVAAAVVGSFLSTLPAQSLNTTLLKHWDRTSTAYSDIWGWTAPDGTEFALVGEYRAIWVLNVTNPQAPTTMAVYSAPSCSWRDFTNLGPFVYSVSECHRGIRVLEFYKSGTTWSVRDHGYKNTSQVTAAHNVRADPATDLVYVLGGNNRGAAIFDCSGTKKTSPSLVSVWNKYYVHDACIRRGKGYFANGRAYFTSIVNVSNPRSIPTIGLARTVGGYNHAAWVSDDDKILCVTNELSRNGNTPHMEVFDISNPAAPVKKGKYDLGSGSVAHNVFMMGRAAYLSYYVHGFRMVDVTNPSSPRETAYYDTTTTTRAWKGAWGTYPFLDSGTIIVSDIEHGFFSIRVDCGHLNRYGKGTAGTKGVPQLSVQGAVPRVAAAALKFEIENLEPNKPFWLAVGATSGTGTVLGATANVNIATATVLGPFQANGSGKATVPAPIANNAGLGGVKAYFQVFGASGSGLISSRGMWLGICK